MLIAVEINDLLCYWEQEHAINQKHCPMHNIPSSHTQLTLTVIGLASRARMLRPQLHKTLSKPSAIIYWKARPTRQVTRFRREITSFKKALYKSYSEYQVSGFL
jgi:hypothetical protein